MASKNVFKIAEELGYWDPKSGQPFRFYEAYSPESRTEFCITRREWRVLDLLAPSLQLHPEQQPLSVLGEAGEAGHARRRSWSCSATRSRAPTST